MSQSFITQLSNQENLLLVLKKLPTVVSLVLVIACAHILSKVTWLVLTENEDPFTVKTSSNASATKKNNPQAFRQLTGANLFGIVGKKKTASIKAPETRLNLVLKGVFATVPMKTASAIIARGKGGKEDIYGIGDKLPSGVTIKEIHPEHVILERKGQLETLRMPKDRNIGKLTNSAGINNKINNRPSTPGAALKQIRSKIIKSPTSFAEYALPVIVRENGKQVGYRLKPQKNGELLADLGLEPSDVITSVNGVKLDDPKNGINALRKLATANEVNITVKRGGAEIPLNIQLQ